MVEEIETPPTEPAARLRYFAGKSLTRHMELAGVTRKQLAHKMQEQGSEVTPQAISLWMNGRRLPRPHLQVEIAKALGFAVRSVFPMDEAA